MDPLTILQIVLVVGGLLLSRVKKPASPSPTAADLQVPTATEDRDFPVVYGAVWDAEPNITWHGQFSVKTQTKNKVKGKRIRLAFHSEMAQGPVDRIIAIRAEDSESEKIIWEGNITPDDYSVLTIEKPDLFGGSESGGGIVGYYQLYWGEETQGALTYLETAVGSELPAMRGVFGGLFHNGSGGGGYIVANSTVIHPWVFRYSRIFRGWLDDDCWYPEKAEIANNSYDSSLYSSSRVLMIHSDKHASGPFVGDYIDSSSYGHHVVTDGTANQDTAVYRYGGSSIDFPSSGLLRVSHQPEFAFGSNIWTGGFWFRTGSSVNRGLFAMTKNNGSTGPASRAWYIRITAGGAFNFNISDGASFYDIGSIDGAPYFDLEWHFLTFGRRANNEWFLSVDNESVTATADISLVDHSSMIILVAASGSGGSPYSEHYNGHLDDIFLISGVDVPANNWGDMNPAHIYYDAMTNPRRGLGYPIADIDDTNFRSAADTYFDEGFGLSFRWARQTSTADFMSELDRTTDTITSVDPFTGLFRITPIRGDYDPDSLDEFDEESIVSIDNFTAQGYGNLISRLTVRYAHTDTGKVATTAPWDNPATLRAQGRMVADTVDFPMIRNHALAARVCAREGRKRSHELRAWSMVVNRKGYGLYRGSVIKVTWPKLGLDGVIVRVMAINYGSWKNREITLGVVEDVYGLPDSSYTAQQSSLWTAPSLTPEPVILQSISEVPYWFIHEGMGAGDAEALAVTGGYIMPLAAQPSAMAFGFDAWSAVPSTYALRKTGAEWNETAALNGAVLMGATSLVIDASTLIDATPIVGRLIQVGTGSTAEIFRVTGGDLITGLTVTGGHLDTTPHDHADNASVWLLPEIDSDLPDTTVYFDGDVVNAKYLSRTDTQVLDIGDATAESITMDSRAARPIAPGNIEINSEAFPTLLDSTLTVTWAHRDRLSHNDTILQTDSGITTEAGVTYNVYAIDDSDESIIDSDTGLSGTTWSPTISGSYTLRIELESVRDGLVSWQRQVRKFGYTDTSFITTEAGDPITTQAGDPLTTET